MALRIYSRHRLLRTYHDIPRKVPVALGRFMTIKGEVINDISAQLAIICPDPEAPNQCVCQPNWAGYTNLRFRVDIITLGINRNNSDWLIVHTATRTRTLLRSSVTSPVGWLGAWADYTNIRFMVDIIIITLGITRNSSDWLIVHTATRTRTLLGFGVPSPVGWLGAWAILRFRWLSRGGRSHTVPRHIIL